MNASWLARSRDTWLVLAVTALYLVASALSWLLTRDVQVVQTAVIALTGVAVIVSALEAVKLRQAATDQIDAQLDATELANRPLVLLSGKPERDVVFLENIGASPALNVRVLPTELRASDAEEAIKLSFDCLDTLIRPGSAGEVRVKATLFDEPVGDYFNAALDPEIAMHPVTITISYENAQMKTYRVRQTIEPGAVTTLSVTVGSQE